MFANQNSATKLRDRFTLDALAREFWVDGEETGATWVDSSSTRRDNLPRRPADQPTKTKGADD